MSRKKVRGCQDAQMRSKLQDHGICATDLFSEEEERSTNIRGLKYVESIFRYSYSIDLRYIVRYHSLHRQLVALNGQKRRKAAKNDVK